MNITSAANYDTDLAAANDILAKRMDAAVDGESDFFTDQHRKSLNDALNNTWVEGLTVAQWADAAASQIGI